MFYENAQCFNDYQTKIKLSYLKHFIEKVSFQVKNENKTSLIQVFPLIIKDQYLDKIFGYTNNIWLSKLP